MGYGFEDERPSAHRYVDAVATSEVAPAISDNYQGLERYLPYSAEADNYLHWFLRFPKEISGPISWLTG